jgi:hypothetical protein
VGEWLFGSILSSILLTAGWHFFTKALPERAARRAARRPDQPMTMLPGVAREEAMPIDVETQLTTNKMFHDRFLEEAGDLILSARGGGLFTEDLLTEAAEKAGDAVKLRPGSFDANVMCGEIAVKQAQRATTPRAIELLEQAVAFFSTAAETKKGVIDTYVGRGWAHLERGHRLEGEQAAGAYLDAAAALSEGFAVNSHNLFVLRGWGLAIDGLARTVGDRDPRVGAAEESYRLALGEHRGGDHELHAWFAGIRAADEPLQVPMPVVRDRF